MKKLFLPIFVLTFAVILSGIWVFQSSTPPEGDVARFAEFYFVGVIVLLFVLGLINAIKRYINKKQGYPEEDEMSRKITTKSASYSFYVSMILWLAILYIHNKANTDPKLLIGFGIVGMALIFSIIWTFVNFKGISGE